MINTRLDFRLFWLVGRSHLVVHVGIPLAVVRLGWYCYACMVAHAPRMPVRPTMHPDFVIISLYINDNRAISWSCYHSPFYRSSCRTSPQRLFQKQSKPSVWTTQWPIDFVSEVNTFVTYILVPWVKWTEFETGSVEANWDLFDWVWCVNHNEIAVSGNGINSQNRRLISSLSSICSPSSVVEFVEHYCDAQNICLLYQLIISMLSATFSRQSL